MPIKNILASKGSGFASAKAEEEMGESRKPHAILVPFPAQGHINPMMRLARRLAHEGFLVGFVTTDYNHSRMVKANNKWDPHTHGQRIRFLILPDGLPPTDTRTDIAKMCHVTEHVIVSFVDKLIAKLKEEDEECEISLITDAMASSALDVAKRHGIPMAALWTSLAATYAILYNLPSLVSTTAVPSNGVPKDFKMVKYLPYMPPLYSAHLPWVHGFTESQQEFIFHFMNRYMERMRELKWVLFNTFHSLEAPVIDGLLSHGACVCSIGPFIPSHFLNEEDVLSESNDEIPTGFWTEEEECLEWLDKQSSQSVIYISFGSLTILNEAQFVEFALGIEATQRPFLWVVRSDLLDGNTAVFPSGFLEATKKRGYLVSWCPQLRVLSHSSIACFITHCGWNSVVESVSMGVPMLCWPYFADQFLNRDYVVNVWKIGLPLNANSDGIIETSEIQRTVEITMTGEEGFEMKRRAVELRKLARDAVKESGSSSTQFREFLNAMVNR